MKNVLLLLVAFFGMTVLTTSCNKETVADTDELISQIATSSEKVAVEPADLPTTISGTVNDVYFETFVYEAFHVQALGYEVMMGNGENLYFDREGTELRSPRGRFHGHGPCGFGPHRGTPVAVADLPTTITDYVTDNYTNPEIKRAKTNNDGEYFVAVKTDDGPVVIKFDADGNFIEEVEFLHHHCHGLTRIMLSDLPTVITDYISTNYPDAEVKKAATKNSNGNYLVFVNDGGDRKILVFDEDGNFLFERG